MEIREVRALEMLRQGHRVAESATPGEFLVASQAGRGIYRVEGVGLPGTFESCTCPDFAERVTAPCKHIYVVRHWLEAQSPADPAELEDLRRGTE